MSDLARVSLSLEASLLDRLEKLTRDSGYLNRSEFIRDLVRERLARAEWEGGREVLGTLTVIYNHHQRGLTEKLVTLQHHWGGHVLTATHVHLSHEVCAEMIMLKGSGDAVNALANAIRSERGVLHASLAMSTTGENLA